jgi:predicted nucleic acid-binding protein
MIKCVDINSFSPSEGEKFILDANILLYVFYTSGKYNYIIVSKYAKLFSEIADNNCKIILSINLLGEFFNKFINLEYESYLKEKSLKSAIFQLKNFKNTVEYKAVLKEMKDIFQLQLLPYAEMITYTTSKELINEMINSAINMDFNDTLYCQTSNDLSIPIVTHDSDFINVDASKSIIIITANNRIISVCNKK